jgi:hypothetical protein
VYYILLALLLLLPDAMAPAQVTLTVDHAMARGPEAAPVTIVQFSDYQ